jgi:hypothetical protein
MDPMDEHYTTVPHPEDHDVRLLSDGSLVVRQARVYDTHVHTRYIELDVDAIVADHTGEGHQWEDRGAVPPPDADRMVVLPSPRPMDFDPHDRLLRTDVNPGQFEPVLPLLATLEQARVTVGQTRQKLADELEALRLLEEGAPRRRVRADMGPGLYLLTIDSPTRPIPYGSKYAPPEEYYVVVEPDGRLWALEGDARSEWTTRYPNPDWRFTPLFNGRLTAADDTRDAKDGVESE